MQGDLPLGQLLRAEFIGPAMPWIDPKKEIEADVMAIDNSLTTRENVIRKRGGDPRKVPEKETNEREPTPTADAEDDEAQRNLEF